MGERYDLVVIGSGPAGEKGAAQAAYFGKRVVVIEKESVLGGACANTGTLPSKTLRESALYLSGLRQQDIYGVSIGDSHERSISVFMKQKDMVVEKERAREAANLARHNVEVLHGTARLVDRHTVRIEEQGLPSREVSGDIILIATGSSPRRPPEIPFDDPDVDDSDEVLQMDRIPKTFIVVGGGVIGSEYASIIAALGVTKVTLIESRDRLLSFLDEEIGDHLTTAFRRMGIDVILGDPIVKYEKPAPRHVRVTLKSGRVVDAERLLAAAGRFGNTGNLGLEEVGVKLDARGLIIVDNRYCTSVDNIFAAGDVIGPPSLVSTSMEQARVAMCHAFGFGYKTAIAGSFPYGLYTVPEAAMIGDTEAQARKAGREIVVGRAYYRDNARGSIINDPEGMLKLIFDKPSRKLLGCHILGERSTDLIHIAQAVIAFEGTVDYFIGAVFNYPTLGELYKYAAYDALGKLNTKPAES